MSTHYQVNEPLEIEWNNLATLPEINRFIYVMTGSGKIWRTIFLSELEKKHVIIKWKISKWQYENIK